MPEKLVIVQKQGFSVCEKCDGLIDTDYEWLGENAEGVGVTRHHNRCVDCGAYNFEDVKGG